MEIDVGSPSWRGSSYRESTEGFFRSDLFRCWNISFVLVTLHVSCQMFFPGGKNWKSSSDYPWRKMLGKGDCSSRNW